MLNFNDCCQEVGYDPHRTAPQLEYEYYGYEQGKAIKCDSEKAARRYKFFEKAKTPESAEAHALYWTEQQALKGNAVQLFQRELRSEYPELNDACYALCYQRAYSAHGCDSYDAVADELEELVTFVQHILRT